MKVWHVASGSSVQRGMLRLGLRNLMFSAWSHFETHAMLSPRTVTMARGADANLFIDSGALSALRTHPATLDWLERQSEIAELAKSTGADLVSHLDVPMERNGLRNARLSHAEALRITIRNARAFMDADVGTSRKVFVIQGYSIDEYRLCMETFEDMGIPDGGMLGVGTCCMRPATRGLWQILEEVRARTSGYELHAFGVGDPDKLTRLASIGIDSVDEGNTVRAFAYRLHPRLENLAIAYRRYDA